MGVFLNMWFFEIDNSTPPNIHQRVSIKLLGCFAGIIFSTGGRLVRTDNSVYVGSFEEDCMSGAGRMTWPDGVEYYEFPYELINFRSRYTGESNNLLG